MAGMLYLVPTPIGNLGDISQRCRETLENADFIAAEDTRVSLKLLNHLGIKKSRREHLESLKTEERTMVFYEAPHKLLTTLADMAEVFGPERPISLCRELTKLHEEVVRTTLGQAITKYTEAPPKGEFVLVVAGAAPVQKETASGSDAAARVQELMAAGLSRKDAVKQTSAELNLPKNVVYDAALHLDEA